MRILGKNHCGAIRRTAFKQHELFQYVLCCYGYSEKVVERFSHQIPQEYYFGNISVSIESIECENFIALLKIDINSTTTSRQRHAVFHFFFI